MKIVINIFIFFANILYSFIKLFKTKYNKITYISRQSNQPGLDFILLRNKLKEINPNTIIVELCKTLDDGLFNKIKYIFHIIEQMYHISTSKVVILDSYCIPISILKHKKDLVVIQMWHALGSLKKFGYSSLEKKDGHSEEISKIMKMHKNYTYILTSSEVSKPYFQEAFNAQDKQMVIMNLPRVDYLKSKEIEKQLKEEFYLKYPNIDKKKKVIVYCPTIREKANNPLEAKATKIELPIEEMVNNIDFKKYIFVVKLHDNKNQIYYQKEKYYEEIYFTGMQFLHIADFIITDYSAIAFETAVTNKPIFFYTFDFDTYMDDRGFYIDFKKEMPGLITKDFKKIIESIEKKQYNLNKNEKFCKKYLGDINKDCTTEFAMFIFEKLNERGAEK